MFRIAVNLQEIGIETVNCGNAPPFTQTFGKEGAFRGIDKLVIGDGKHIAETVHIFLRYPEADACAEIVVSWNLIIIPEAVGTFPDDPCSNSVFIFTEPCMDQVSDILIIKSSVLFHNFIHKNHPFYARKCAARRTDRDERTSPIIYTEIREATLQSTVRRVVVTSRFKQYKNQCKSGLSSTDEWCLEPVH
jgi:hypothetical protein